MALLGHYQAIGLFESALFLITFIPNLQLGPPSFGGGLSRLSVKRADADTQNLQRDNKICDRAIP